VSLLYEREELYQKAWEHPLLKVLRSMGSPQSPREPRANRIHLLQQALHHS
jgi:hypothetical protein